MHTLTNRISLSPALGDQTLIHIFSPNHNPLSITLTLRLRLTLTHTTHTVPLPMAMSGASPNQGVSSPWSQIVAAASASAAPPVVDSAAANSAPAEDSDIATRNIVDTGRSHAWNKPSNDASSSVIGADSWPALSESARAPAKSSSPPPSESAKGSVDASTAPPLRCSGSVVPSPQRPVQTHQKSIKLSNSNTSFNGLHPPPQMSRSQGPMAPVGPHNYNSSLKDRQGGSGILSSDHSPRQSSFRHWNGGGPHQRVYCGNQDWNNHNFNGRDNYMSQRFPRFIRPPPPLNPAQLYPPPPPLMHPYGPIGFHDLPPQMVYVPFPPLESMRGVPFVSPIPSNAMYFQPPDNQLHTKIVNQIDYYFSNENLINDIYLRRNMDDQGWVPINLIAGFKKVKYLTENIQILLDAVRTSSVVEVQGDKMRRRNDWRKWIMPPDQVPKSTSKSSWRQISY